MVSGAEGFLEETLGRLAEAAERAAGELAAPAARYAAWARQTLSAGGRIYVGGNGGSAATAQHVAAEYVVRFRRRRRPLPAEALGSSTPELTAAANDFGFDAAFARAVEARVAPEDLVVLHSTSGSSENVVRAAEAAGRSGARSVALTGAGGGALAEAADLWLGVPAEDPARIQELHLALEHAVVQRVEEWATGAEPPDGAGPARAADRAATGETTAPGGNDVGPGA